MAKTTTKEEKKTSTKKANDKPEKNNSTKAKATYKGVDGPKTIDGQELAALSAEEARSYEERYFNGLLNGKQISGKITNVDGLDDEDKSIQAVLEENRVWSTKSVTLDRDSIESLTIFK